MFKNKIDLKKYLFFNVIVSLILTLIFIILNIKEYQTITKNYNDKIINITIKIKEKYPNIKEDEIMDILNSKNKNIDIFSKYGIDINKESLILLNEQQHYLFLIINLLLFIITIFIIITIFLKYEQKKDKQLKEITKYIEEINKKNYTLHIDEMSEDELSILKNEIYKTTILLKESADNSLKDKKHLKKSLEDISHQLKTPLTSILIILDNLIDNQSMDNQTRQDFIRILKREVMNTNFLVQNILKLSKLDSNTIQFNKKEYLVKDIIDKSLKNVSVICDLKNIKYVVKGDNKIKIYCDFNWQVEAISNIIKNCLDYSKENSKIIISYEEKNVYTLIKIKDFGSGILESDIPHIFQRFYKGKNSNSDSVGIGLALAKSIINEDNGNINVRSSKDGTEFIIKYFKL